MYGRGVGRGGVLEGAAEAGEGGGGGGETEAQVVVVCGGAKWGGRAKGPAGGAWGGGAP